MAKTAPTSKEWRFRPRAPFHAVERTTLPSAVAHILSSRGITSRDEADSFLNPLPHNPALLPDMEPALQRLSRALEAGETIGVYGDFDVDGVTGTALLVQGLRDLGAKAVPYLPDRLTEGHGLNSAAVQVLKKEGVSVLVTVDCGVTSSEEVALAQELGMDVIITDHHTPLSALPPALAVIDPKLAVSEYPFPDLSGAGLVFKLVQGLCDLLGQPWKRDLLELAALSTVADLVPLKNENRFLVKEGLKELKRTSRPGLIALFRHAGIRADNIDSDTISFKIAPRLNAAGRLEHASTSYQLLLARSVDEGETLAARLETLNRKRQQLTEEACSRAREIVLGWSPLPPILLIEDSLFSPGLAGLVASKLVDELCRPVVVMSTVGGVIRASARSIPEFNMAKALSQCDDLFRTHGGHPQAAGFAMAPENMALLKERLCLIAEEELAGIDPRPGIDIDAEVPVASLAGETFRWIKALEPFGVQNPAPVFLTRNLRPIWARSMGNRGQHLRVKLKEGMVVWDAVAFGQGDRWKEDVQLVDVVYNIGTDWRDGTEVLALNVLDFRPSVC